MVLLFIAHDNLLYGSNRSLVSILNELVLYPEFELNVIFPLRAEKIIGMINIDVKCYTVDYDLSLFFKEKCPNKLSKLRYYPRKIKGYYRVLKTVKKINPDIIYTNNSIVNHGIFSALLLRLPHVWQYRESVKRHNLVFGNLSYDFGDNIQRWLYSKSRVRISNSLSIKTDFQQNFQVDSKLIYNGVVKKKSIILNHGKMIQAKIKLAIVGRVSKNKGQLKAIKALNILNSENEFSYQLMIIGEGNISYLKENRNQNELKNVKLIGFVDDLSEVYKNTNLLLVCSEYESFGRTIVEAFSYGIPVISSRCGGPEEILEDGISGCFFDGSPNDLATKIKKALEPATYEKLSKGALKRAHDFTVEKNVQKLVDIFKSITI